MASDRPYTPTLHLKTRESNDRFVEARARITEIVPRSWIDHLIEETAKEVRLAVFRHGKAAYAWSAGKDSVALQVVMAAAGVQAGFASLTPLEWPEQRRWARENLPSGVVLAPQENIDLAWLKAHPDLLFPVGNAGPEWASLWHKAQTWYFRLFNPAVIFNGRRRADGNHTPDTPKRLKNGQLHLTPMAYWTHEDVFAAIEYYSEWPPVYTYPNAFIRGTGPWPYIYPHLESEEASWRWVCGIDPSVVKAAAKYFPLAKQVLEQGA